MMSRKTTGFLLVAAAVAMLGLARTQAAGATEKFNLNELKDGESRVFGAGAHAITATRRGDAVTIQHPGKDGAPVSTDCTIGKDSCFVMTTDGSGRTMVFIGKGGDGAPTVDEDVFVSTAEGEAGKGGKRVIVRTMKGGKGGEHVVTIDGHGDGDVNWTSADAGDGDMHVMHLEDPNTVMLRCPEGDTTMRLKKDEAATTYTCPKHGKTLEPFQGSKVIVKKIIVSDEKDKEKSK